MRRGGVTQTVNRFHYSAESSEVADSVVGAFDVVIDSARQTDAREAHFSQTFCTHIRTVAANNYQRIDTAFFQVFDRDSANIFVTEFRETAEPRKVPPRLIMSDTL